MKLHIETGTENTILRTVSTEILPSEIREYARLGETMVRYIADPDHKACGLAAPQIGVNKRLLVADLLTTWEDDTYRTVIMINPIVVEISDTIETDTEGCLSLPDVSGHVPRPTWIKVRYTDERGRAITVRLPTLASRIVAHEIDHLDGILFTDRAISPLFT